jgi:hypothetical protein
LPKRPRLLTEDGCQVIVVPPEATRDLVVGMVSEKPDVAFAASRLALTDPVDGAKIAEVQRIGILTGVLLRKTD